MRDQYTKIHIFLAFKMKFDRLLIFKFLYESNIRIITKTKIYLLTQKIENNFLSQTNVYSTYQNEANNQGNMVY